MIESINTWWENGIKYIRCYDCQRIYIINKTIDYRYRGDMFHYDPNEEYISFCDNCAEKNLNGLEIISIKNVNRGDNENKT